DWLLVPCAALAAAVGMAAVVSPVLAVAAVAALLFMGSALRSLAAGVALFTLLVFFTRIPALSGSDVTLVRLAGGLLAVLWFIRVARRGSDTPVLLREHPAVAYTAMAFFAWTAASMLWATDVAVARYNSFQFLQAIVLFFVVFSAVNTRRHLWWVVVAFVVGATLSAFTGLIGYTTPERYALSPGRLTGGIRDANELAAILVPALALAIFGAAAARARAVRWLLVVCALVTAFGLFRTESRGGLVALFVMFVVALVLAGPIRARAVAMMGAAIGAGIVYYTAFAPPEALARVTTFREGGGSGRTDIWTIAMEVWRDNPILGVGAGNFEEVESLYTVRDVAIERLDLVVDRATVAHNTYLHIVAELGLVGLALFAGLIVSTFVIAWGGVARLREAGDVEMELLARGLMIGTIGMLTAFFFISGQNLKQIPLLLGTLAALSSIGRLRASQRAASPGSTGALGLRPTSGHARAPFD
ncbi:MAG: O-antigen ligase family protein, partial [Burkholderiales bacterium]